MDELDVGCSDELRSLRDTQEVSLTQLMLPGKRNHIPPCSSEKLCFTETEWDRKGKNSVLDVVSLGLLYLPPVREVSLEASKVFQKIFFGGGSASSFVPM